MYTLEERLQSRITETKLVVAARDKNVKAREELFQSMLNKYQMLLIKDSPSEGEIGQIKFLYNELNGHFPIEVKRVELTSHNYHYAVRTSYDF